MTNAAWAAKVWGDPHFYRVIDWVAIESEIYGLPKTSIGSRLYIIAFDVADIANPKVDPIGVFHYAGIRRFLWHEEFWSEYNLDHRAAMDQAALLLRNSRVDEEAIELRKILSFLQRYAASTAPNKDDHIDNNESMGKEFCRAMYRIEVQKT